MEAVRGSGAGSPRDFAAVPDAEPAPLRAEDALLTRRYRCPACRAVEHPLGTPRPLAAAATQTSIAAGAHVRLGRVVHRRPFLRGADCRAANPGTPFAARDAGAGAGTTRGNPRGVSSAFEAPSPATGTKRARSAPRSARGIRARAESVGPRSAFPATPPVPPAAAESHPAESEDARRVARRVLFDAHAPVDWTFARRQSSASRAAAVEAAAAAAAEAELRRFARALLPDEAFAHHLGDDFDVDSPPNLSPPRPPEVYFDIAGTRAAAGRTTASSLFIDEAAPSPGTPSEPLGGGVGTHRRARHAAGSGHIAALGTRRGRDTSPPRPPP